MQEIIDELLASGSELQEIAKKLKTPEIQSSISLLESRVQRAEDSFSGSWLGYHSCVYYRALQVPPPGADFSQFTGLSDDFLKHTKGDWVELSYDQIIAFIENNVDNPTLDELVELAFNLDAEIRDQRQNINSVLSTVIHEQSADEYVKQQLEEIKGHKLIGPDDLILRLKPRGTITSKDIRAATAKSQIPPHIAVHARLEAAKFRIFCAESLASHVDQIVKHLRRANKLKNVESMPNKIFIGHGRADDWKELRDLLRDRMRLEYDEFNRVATAGLPNVVRISQMMGDACFAFLIFTAEDEQADGKMHARMNVVHEAGLFQGKLGFEKAIMLVENGCESFSNVDGIGQIRYDKGNMAAKSEEIRGVLEREGILELA